MIQKIDKNKRREILKVCVESIISDLSGRGGLGGIWDDIDDDVQEEIRESWTDILEEELEGCHDAKDR